MNWRLILWGGLGTVGSVAAVGGAMDSFTSSGTGYQHRADAKREAGATLAALKPPKRRRPQIATETTDYLTPYGILRRSDVADVALLATESGPVKLYPALKVKPQATVAEFDAKYPDGADYVIVPAMKS